MTFTDPRDAISKAIADALASLVKGKPTRLVRWEMQKRVARAPGFDEVSAATYVANCWPEMESQAARRTPNVPSVPSPPPEEPMKILNPLAAASARAQPLPASAPPAPKPAKPEPPSTDLAALIAGAISKHLDTQDLDEARVIALIREHGGTPAPQPGLVLSRGDGTEPVKYDKPLHAYAPLLIKLIDAKIAAYVWSGAGTGKTRLVEACAEMLKLPYYSDSYTRGMGRAEILGFRDAHGNPVETQLSQAYAKGGLYLADEGDADGIGIIALNRALANDHAVFAGRLIPKHPDFRMCFAANTPGTGQANGYRREPIDAALLDRMFVVELPVDRCLEHQAAGIGGKVPKPPPMDLERGGVITPEAWAETVGAYREAAEELAIGTPLTTSGRPLWIGKELAIRGVGRGWLIDGLIRKSRSDDAWKPWAERAEGKL